MNQVLWGYLVWRVTTRAQGQVFVTWTQVDIILLESVQDLNVKKMFFRFGIRIEIMKKYIWKQGQDM
jgi:hypothetical protein